MALTTKNPICDIIIPVWNQLEYTKDCIESLFKDREIAFRLIIIDNASAVQTAEYLFNLKRRGRGRVILIRNDKNKGFIKAVNQGIRESSAPYLCLLNNDTKVCTGWLKEMIKVAASRKDIGIVNPNSNTLGCKPEKEQSPEAVAQSLRADSGQYSELGWACGFCMLIKRELVEKVGFFDEIYGMGTFEDADFSKRAQALGYLCVCARAAYVYHHERRSFINFDKFDQNFRRNRKIFFEKWGRTERILYILKESACMDAERIAEESLRRARQGNMIWIFLKDKKLLSINPHNNIFLCKLRKSFFKLACLWRILKRKKRFDRIYVDNEKYLKSLNKFKILHKAKVEKI